MIGAVYLHAKAKVTIITFLNISALRRGYSLIIAWAARRPERAAPYMVAGHSVRV